MRYSFQFGEGTIVFSLAFLLAGAIPTCADEGLKGDLRIAFVDASLRSCLKTQIDEPVNQTVPVFALIDYCKCYSSGLADKFSNDEVARLEAEGSEQNYQVATHDRAEITAKGCLETVRKTITKPD